MVKIATEKKKTAKRQRQFGNGSVYYVESRNAWIGKYNAGRKPNGKPDIKTVSGKTEAEAHRKLNKLIDDLKREGYVYIQKEAYSKYITTWLTTIKKLELKPKSYDRLEQTVNSDVIPYIGGLQVDAITTGDIQMMISGLVDDNRSYSSVKKAYDAVNASFKWGLSVIPPKVKYNPAIAVKLPKKSTFDPVEIKYYNAEEARLISKTALTKYPNGTPWYPLGEVVVVLLNTGLRLSEVTALQWARDIDMESRLLYVHRNVVVIKNREDDKKKFVTVEQKTVKSAAGQDRVIPLNDDAFHAFQSLKEKTGHTMYVFATKQGERKSTRDIDKIVRRVEKRAGLPDDKIYGPHALRHTFATLLLQNGVDIKTVSELLGHADIGITYNTYIHVMKEQKAKAVASIPNFISGDDNTSCLQKADN